MKTSHPAATFSGMLFLDLVEAGEILRQLAVDLEHLAQDVIRVHADRLHHLDPGVCDEGGMRRR